MAMRFHLDEHVDPAIAHGLRLRGIDATTTDDVDLLGAPDEAHLEFARREIRVIFTNDSDFLRFAAANLSHPGIAYCARNSRSIGYVVRHLCLMHDCLEVEDIYGKVEYL
jgi:predicted nuclease of predicted toxin-antitoxin system